MTLHIGWRGAAHQARVPTASGGGAGEPDTTPESFSFPPATAAALSTLYESAPVTVSGMDSPTGLTIAGGEYSINGGAFGSGATLVSSGDAVRVRGSASASVSTTATVALTVGGVVGTFEITTVAHSEASALILRFAAPPDSARRGLIDTCIGSLKSAGVWPKLDVLYLFAAHDSQAARRNWVQDLYNATAQASPTFTADRGYEGDGAASHIDTNAPNNALTKFSQADASLGVWVNADNGATNPACGNLSSRLQLTPGPATLSARLSTSTSTSGANPTADRRGHLVACRPDAANQAIYKNGILVASSASATASVAAGNFWALRQGGVFSNDRVAAMHVGSHLTAGEVGQLHTALNTYLTAIGGA